MKKKLAVVALVVLVAAVAWCAAKRSTMRRQTPARGAGVEVMARSVGRSMGHGGAREGARPTVGPCCARRGVTAPEPLSVVFFGGVSADCRRRYTCAAPPPEGSRYPPKKSRAAPPPPPCARPRAAPPPPRCRPRAARNPPSVARARAPDTAGTRSGPMNAPPQEGAPAAGRPQRPPPCLTSALAAFHAEPAPVRPYITPNSYRHIPTLRPRVWIRAPQWAP